jgi:hypothetical protein
MKPPRGPDVSPDLQWYPIVTMLQIALDMAVATNDNPCGDRGDRAALPWQSSMPRLPLNTTFKFKCTTGSTMAAGNPIVHCSINLALTA